MKVTVSVARLTAAADEAARSHLCQVCGPVPLFCHHDRERRTEDGKARPRIATSSWANGSTTYCVAATCCVG